MQKWQFLIFLILPLCLYSDIYNPCFLKNVKSIYQIDGVNCIALSEDKLFCHDTELKIKNIPPEYGVIKYNKFHRNYLLKSSKSLNPIVLKNRENQEFVLVDINGYKISNILSYPNYDTTFGKLTDSSLGKVMGIKCYKAVGVGAKNDGFFTANYLSNFLLGANSEIGDIGISFEAIDNKYIISKKDIYFKNNPFLTGDEIVRIDNKKFNNIAELSEYIMFSKIGATLNVEIIRKNKLLKFQVKSDKKFAGGFVKETFLQRFGIMLNDKLEITDVEEGSFADKKWLKNGDKILAVDRIMVNNIDELVNTISAKKNKETSLLIRRGEFDFFTIIR